MSLIQHKITLDVKTFRSVEPIMMFTDSASAYSIIVKITDGGKEVDLSEYDTFKMEIEGTQTTNFPEGTVENNRIVFELSNTMINEGWTVCDVTMMSGSTLVKTQVFQIYKQIFNAVQVDETPFAQISQPDLQRLLNMSTSLSGADFSALKNITSSDVARLKGMTQSEIDQWDSAITSVEDQSGSYISNNKLYIVPKIQDVMLNENSILDSNGVANISMYDITHLIEIESYTEWGSNHRIISIPSEGDSVGLDVGVERIKLNGEFLENIQDSYNPNDNEFYTTVSFDAVERVKLNGATLETANPNINAVTGVKIGNTNIDAVNTHPRIELDSSDGVSLTPNTTNHKVTIGFDTSNPSFEVPIDRITAPNNTDDGSLAVYTNGHFEAQDWVSALNLSVTESGSTVSITEGNRSVEIHNINFTPVTSIDDTSNMLFLTSNDNRQRISWANLMSLFEKYFMTRHKTVYFTKAIAGNSWSGDTATVTLGSSDFENTDITADDMVGNHTHAHIHPEPDSVYEFANYGIYCSAVNAENGDAVLTFKRNTTLDGSVMPLVNVTIEVRLDVEDT